MLENFRDEFLVKDELYGEIIEGAAQMHFKQPPPKQSEYSQNIFSENTTPNPNKFFYDLMNQNFSVLNSVLDDSDDDLIEAQYSQEFCGNITQSSPRVKNQNSKYQTKFNIVDINYHKELRNRPQTHIKFKSFSLKLLSQLFEIPLNIIQQKTNNENFLHQLVEVSNETQIVSRKNFYDFEDYITMKIWRQGKKADPHESIFKTLTRRIKVNFENIHKNK